MKETNNKRLALLSLINVNLYIQLSAGDLTSCPILQTGAGNQSGGFAESKAFTEHSRCHK